ncbi:MAG: tyrosine recombinase XerC [Clostridia bacterium]|nr:tyrosine recombinase XerC [Clostridia bacterium]
MIDTTNNPEFLNAFLQYITTILNKSENTVKEYNYDLNHFLKFIMYHYHLTSEEDIKSINIKNMDVQVVKKIQLDDIHAFLFYLTNTYHSKPATRARKIASIRVFFKYLANKERILEVDPTIGLETPKQEKRLPKYLSLENSEKLLEVTRNESGDFKERDFAIITLFLNCGMRLSELVGINIKDIDFSENKLTVIGKGNKERTIYLNKACIDAINDYLKVRPHEGVKFDSKDALFLSKRKERISNRMVQEIVKRELAKSGLDINKYSTHKLRHTAATLMYQYGNVDIRALQVLLGHQSISTTQIYTHVENEQVRAAVEKNPLANRKF